MDETVFIVVGFSCCFKIVVRVVVVVLKTAANINKKTICYKYNIKKNTQK